MHFRLITILLSIASLHVAAQDTMTGIFEPSMATLQVRVNGSDMQLPLMRLASDDRLEIHFDELADDRRYLRYRLVHCDRNWRPSDILDAEYVDGFNEATIDDCRFSRTTTVPYVHYTATFGPDEGIRPTLSGNYLVQIYDEDEPDSTLIQQRIIVVEPTASLRATVDTNTDIDYNDRHQQLSLEVDLGNMPMVDPWRDIAVVVTQNGRADIERVVGAPSRIAGNRLVYEHQPALIFPAGNEYRRMETVSVHHTPMHVESVEYHGPYYHAFLAADEPRADKSYYYDQTQHGRFRIREYNSTDQDVEADYVMTHFTLVMPELSDCYIFLDGDFTSRRFDEKSYMEYDREQQAYTKTLLMKQGAYNYQYLAVHPGQNYGDTATIEGDYCESTNEYTVKVYYRRPGERYDRLIGVFTVNR